MNKIGVFSGTFDPIHKGHLEACLVAKGALSLVAVLLFIEKNPLRKQKITSYRNRAEMLDLAIKDYSSFRHVDFSSDNITTPLILNYLQQNYPSATYYYIFGSDMIEHMHSWKDIDKLITNFHLCIVLRNNHDEQRVKQNLKKLQSAHHDVRYTILPSVWSMVSSSTVKQEIGKNGYSANTPKQVNEYIVRHKLYVT